MINKFTLLLFVLVSCRNGSSPLFAGPAPRADTPTPGAPLSASDGTEVYATADDGTLLRWTVFAPLGTGKHPAVLVIHGGGFVAAPASPNTKMAARDLAAAGYLAFEIKYRLAPPGHIAGQKSSGRFPDQTNDVHLAVHAARTDPRGNGQVGGVGGSLPCRVIGTLLPIGRI